MSHIDIVWVYWEVDEGITLTWSVTSLPESGDSLAMKAELGTRAGWAPETQIFCSPSPKVLLFVNS